MDEEVKIKKVKQKDIIIGLSKFTIVSIIIILLKFEYIKN